MYLLRWLRYRMERKTDRMRKGVIKAVVLLVVFGLTVVIMGLFSQQNDMNMTSEMPQVTVLLWTEAECVIRLRL